MDKFSMDEITINYSKPKWEWDVFGGGELVANIISDPPLYRRILTMVLLGSKWRANKQWNRSTAVA